MVSSHIHTLLDRVKANQIRVTWNDPDDHYKQTVELSRRYKRYCKNRKNSLKKKLLLMDVLHKSQAHRIGKYHLLTETLDSEVVTFA